MEEKDEKERVAWDNYIADLTAKEKIEYKTGADPQNQGGEKTGCQISQESRFFAYEKALELVKIAFGNEKDTK